MKKKKPSEVFEGENSSLRKTFDEATRHQQPEKKCEHPMIESNMCASYCRICGEVLREQNEKEEFNEDARVIDMLEKHIHRHIDHSRCSCGKLCDCDESNISHPEPSREWEEEFDRWFEAYKSLYTVGSIPTSANENKIYNTKRKEWHVYGT